MEAGLAVGQPVSRIGVTVIRGQFDDESRAYDHEPRNNDVSQSSFPPGFTSGARKALSCAFEYPRGHDIPRTFPVGSPLCPPFSNAGILQENRRTVMKQRSYARPFPNLSTLLQRLHFRSLEWCSPMVEESDRDPSDFETEFIINISPKYPTNILFVENIEP